MSSNVAVEDVDNDVLVPENVFDSYDDAFSFLMTFKHHMIGQLVEVMYRKPLDEHKDTLGAIVAIGTKDSDAIGMESDEELDDDDDDDESRANLGQYCEEEGGKCGAEYFEVISCHCNGSGPNSKYITKIRINGVPFEVYNNVKRNEEVEDPFIWESLAKDSEGNFVDPVVPVDPNKPEGGEGNTDITFNDSQFVVASREDQSVEDAFDWSHSEDVFGGFEVPDNPTNMTNVDDIFGEFENK